jgi:hypothetical protein
VPHLRLTAAVAAVSVCLGLLAGPGMAAAGLPSAGLGQVERVCGPGLPVPRYRS